VHVSVGQFERAPDRTSSGPFRFSHASEIASCAAESREYFGERTIEFANPEALYLPEDAPTIWRGQFGKEAVDWLYMKDFACSPLRHYRFNNLRVMGSVTCITEDNQIFDGQLRPFDESSFLALAGLHHSDMRQGANGQIVSERAQQPPTFVPGKTLLLPDGGLPMHYHFLYDFLPRLWIRQQPEFADLKVAVPNLIDLPEVGILNDFYGVPTSDLLIYDVEGPGTVFESAYLVPNFTTDYWTMPEVIEMPRRALTLATAPKSEKLRNARKIYVSRRNIKHPRHLINEDELVRQLEKLGFVEVFPDEHSYAEEMYIFNNADVVVGVFGSGMANTIFCRKGTKVLILQPDSCNWRGLSFPMKFLELHYGYHFGNSFRRLERFHNTEWLVNIEAVAAQIQAWET
jgi:capsular polysaccharide biosynthesis protein